MSSVSHTDGGYQFYQRNLGDLENEMRDETRRTRERYDERADSLEKKMIENSRRLEKNSEEAVGEIRENASTQIEKDRENARADADRAKAQMYDKFGRTQVEIAHHQKRADEAIRQSQEELEIQKAKVNRASDVSTEKLAQASNDRLEKNAKMEHDSRDRESGVLRQTIKHLIENEGGYMKEKGQGLVDARKEIENDARTREYVISKQYEDQLDQMQRKAVEADRNYSRMAEDQRRDHDIQFAKTVRGINQQHQDDTKYLSENTDRAIAQTQDLARRQAANSEKAMERQAATMTENQENALSHQAETFRSELSSQKDQDQSTIHRLESEITGHLTSGDQTWVSPAAEAKMRDGFIQEYDKKHQAQITRDKEKTDSLQKEYTTRIASTIQDADTRITQTELQRRADEHVQRQDFMNHIDEVQKNQEQVLRDKDYQSIRQAESLNHTYGTSLERQRREYENMLSQLKTESNEKIASTRQQAEFDAKMAQRGFAAQQYELIKNQERKLEEQKNSYEDTIGNLKEQLAKSDHEAERRSRQLLEDQAKGYDQRIAEMQYQTKERERSISDNYQDQIEKLKRSNALLIQRKS